jgi:hypothetical protein
MKTKLKGQEKQTKPVAKHVRAGGSEIAQKCTIHTFIYNVTGGSAVARLR